MRCADVHDRYLGVVAARPTHPSVKQFKDGRFLSHIGLRQLELETTDGIVNCPARVTQRQHLRSSQTEVPAYNSSRRLKTLTATVGGNSPQVVLNVTYDARDNICTTAGQTDNNAGRDGCNVTGTGSRVPIRAGR